MFKKLFIIGLISSSLMACTAKVETNSNSNLVSGNANSANTTNTATNANITTPVSNNANVATKPAVDNSPKRISFGKGANWGTANVILAPNATQLFVISAKSGQMMDVESSSKDVAINLRKGKAQTTEDFGYLNAELQSNGDYVFEVKNTSKKEVKTSIKVTIEGGNVKADEIDESDSTVKDDPDVLPPPTKKKGN